MFTYTNETVELFDEAQRARLLAAQMNHSSSVRDLLQYAFALESEAARLGEFGPERTRGAYCSVA